MVLDSSRPSLQPSAQNPLLRSPVVQFLIDANPDVYTSTHDVCLDNCGTASTGEIDRGVLLQLVRQHYAKGQDVLENFRKWLIRTEGETETSARKHVAAVWNALCITYDKATGKSDLPRLLDPSDSTYKYATKATIKGSLRRWATYSKDSALMERLLLIDAARPRREPQYVLHALAQNKPYGDSEYKRLLKALEEYKGTPVAPWGYPLMKIILTYGMPIGLLRHLTKGDIALALQRGVLMLRRSKRVKTLLVEPIREALELLASFQWEWGTVAQLVNPRSPNYFAPFLAFTRQVFHRAKVPIDRHWQYRMKLTAAWRYYKKTKDIVGTSQILDSRDLNRVSNMITFLQKYAIQEKAQLVVEAALAAGATDEDAEDADEDESEAEDAEEEDF